MRDTSDFLSGLFIMVDTSSAEEGERRKDGEV